VLWLTVREHAAAAGQYRRDMLELLVTAAPNRIPRLEELSAYDLGTYLEAVAAGGPTPYLPRDKDDELDAAIVRAARAHDPSMVVLRGPSKSGKSRTLYESAKRIGELRGAFVLAPRHRDALARLLDEGPPVPRRAQVVLWLDDLERFVSAGHDGMANATLDALREWGRPLVLLATAGGMGAELLTDGLSVPIRQLYGQRGVGGIAPTKLPACGGLSAGSFAPLLAPLVRWRRPAGRRSRVRLVLDNGPRQNSCRCTGRCPRRQQRRAGTDHNRPDGDDRRQLRRVILVDDQDAESRDDRAAEYQDEGQRRCRRSCGRSSSGGAGCASRGTRFPRRCA
jgi:hypothetical protein